MKRFYIILIVLLLPTLLCAQDFTVDGISYFTNKDETPITTCRVTSPLGERYSGHLVIPSTVTYGGKTYTVTMLGNGAFIESSIETVSLPPTVTKIGDATFKNCSKLKSIDLTHITHIGGEAFQGCPMLKQVTISNEVSTLYYRAFSESGLESVVFEGDCELIIPETCFQECRSLKRLTFSDGNGSIRLSDRCFTNCTSLENVYVGTSFAGGYNTIQGASSHQIFTGCSGFDVVWNATKVHDFSFFRNGSGVNSKIVGFGDDTNYLPDYCFFNRTDLVSYDIDSRFEKIGAYAFSGCNALVSVSIPSSVTSIGSGAFQNCKKLPSVDIPSSVTFIASSAFSGCTSLNSITIPNSVTTIGKYAFKGCTALSHFYLPSSITVIPEGLFEECSGITEDITIPEGVTMIDDRAFYYCSMSKISLPSTLTDIGEQGLCCPNLSTIECYASTPPRLYWDEDGYYVFGRYGTLHVVESAKSSYQQHSGWNRFTIVADLPLPSIDITENGLPYNNINSNNYKKLNYIRTFNNTKWQALYIPFSMSYSDWSEDFEVAAINNFHSYDIDNDGQNETWQLEIEKINSGTLRPNHPYMIKAKETGTKTITLDNVLLCPTVVNSIDCSSVSTKYTFTGTYTPINNMKTSEYYFMSGGNLCSATDDEVTLSPFRWFMKIETRDCQLLPGVSMPKSLKVVVLGEDDQNAPTGVSNVELNKANKLVFDVYGRKVDDTILKPGLYVKNGKKILVR